jgi:hypothetical protein
LLTLVSAWQQPYGRPAGAERLSCWQFGRAIHMQRMVVLTGCNAPAHGSICTGSAESQLGIRA